MKKILYIALAIVLTAACTRQKAQKTENNEAISTEQNLEGDSTIYGLACDGCTDTILVFLPRTGGDPDTFNILNASRTHHVFGRPMIGDQLAIVVNPNDPKVADIVIDMEVLKGEWCYIVKPELKEWAGMTQAIREAMMADSAILALMQPREYGFQIKSDYTARPIGTTYTTKTSDDQSPVEYPEQKLYREWRIHNGHLVLSVTERDSTGNQQVTYSDTTEFVMMRRDTLVLRFADGERGYYKKDSEPSK